MLSEDGGQLLLVSALCRVDQHLGGAPVGALQRGRLRQGPVRRGFDHRCFGAVESLKRRVQSSTYHSETKPCPLFVFRNVGDGKLGMSQRAGQSRHRHLIRCCGRPFRPSRQAAGEDADVISMVRDRKRYGPEIVMRRRRTKRRDDPAGSVVVDEASVRFRPFPDDRIEAIVADHGLAGLGYGTIYRLTSTLLLAVWVHCWIDVLWGLFK